MELQGFVEKFKELFEEEDVTTISGDTEFKTLEEWSSMVALYFIAMVDEEYGITVTGAQIRSAVTIKDLFNVIRSKSV